MVKVHPFLWFDTQAEEAANFYCSVFPDSRVLEVSRYGEGSPFPEGTAMTVSFEIVGQQVTALNGGPHFKLDEAFSLHVSCESQEEVDEYWTKLIAGGGEESQCGWLKDRFGLSWQIIPNRLSELLQDDDSEKAGRVLQTMLGQKKIDVPALELAYNGS